MNPETLPPATPRNLDPRIIGVFSVFLLALGVGVLGDLSQRLLGMIGCIVGLALAIGLARLWGERTRPRTSLGWALLLVLWIVLLVFVSFQGDLWWRPLWLAVLVSLPVGLFARHGLGTAPSLMMAAVLYYTLFSAGRLASVGGRLGEADAVWIAAAMVVAIAAATLEHERLARQKGAGTPTAWTVLRLAFVAAWTLVILILREDIQWIRIFALLGIDLGGHAGRFFLFGLIVAAIAIAAFALRPTKPRRT